MKNSYEKFSLNIRDYFRWIFKYKTIKDEYETQELQSQLQIIELNGKIKKRDNQISNRQQEKQELVKWLEDKIEENKGKKLIVENLHSRFDLFQEENKIYKEVLNKMKGIKK